MPTYALGDLVLISIDVVSKGSIQPRIGVLLNSSSLLMVVNLLSRYVPLCRLCHCLCMNTWHVGLNTNIVLNIVLDPRVQRPLAAVVIVASG